MSCDADGRWSVSWWYNGYPRRQKDLENIQADILEQLISSLDKESLSQNTLDSVLRVYCTHVQPSQSQPWQKVPQVSSTSSGAHHALFYTQ
jgi:hypothetical protein